MSFSSWLVQPLREDSVPSSVASGLSETRGVALGPRKGFFERLVARRFGQSCDVRRTVAHPDWPALPRNRCPDIASAISSSSSCASGDSFFSFLDPGQIGRQHLILQVLGKHAGLLRAWPCPVATRPSAVTSRSRLSAARAPWERMRPCAAQHAHHLFHLLPLLRVI